MAKVTKALYGRLVERCLRAGGVPRLGACWVMLAIAEMEMRGVSPPPQASWAGNLGISERSLREYLGELRELGLVVSYRVASAPGIAGNAHRLNVPLAGQWVSGEIEIGGMISERQILPEPSADFAGGADSGRWSERQILPEAPADFAGPRARGNAVAVGVTVDAAIAAGVAKASAEAAVSAVVSRAVGALRAGGVRVPYLVKLEIETWTRRGMTDDDWQEMAEKGAKAGMNRFDYLVPAIQERVGWGAVTPLAEYRRAPGREQGAGSREQEDGDE